MMKKDTAKALPAIPPDPARALPSPRPRRERISLRELFFSAATREGEGRSFRPALLICAAVVGVLLLVTVVGMGMSGGLEGMGNAWKGFWQGGSPPLLTPPTADAEEGTREDSPTVEEGMSADPATEAPTHGEESMTHTPTDTEEASMENPMENPTENPTEEVGGGTDSTENPTDGELTDEPTKSPETVPPGCIAIVSVDMSDKGAGVDHVTVDSGAFPLTPAEGIPFDGEEIPAVLLVHTHPLEGYSDGGAWYDPATGGLAQTARPNAPDGVVALGMALTRYLRGQGITVIHLRVPVEVDDTATTLYERVETAVEDACALYPRIGLILDLRRSAELTQDGGILRTAGFYMGNCAQLGISVHGRRNTAERDLAAALALRRFLWGTETTLSRPARVRNSEGIAPWRSDIPCLTLELGSAGNTYAEAEALIPPLGSALIRLLSGIG